MTVKEDLASLLAFVILVVGLSFAAYVGLSFAAYYMKPTANPAVLLPDNLRDRGTVLGMLVGDVGFIVPQTMVVDKDGRCFLKADHSVDPNGAGRFTMKIAREKDGYHVFATAVRRNAWKLNSNLNWLETVEGLVPVAQIN